MSQNFYWSSSRNSFFPVELLDAYRASNSFPSDAVLVDDTVFNEYSGNPPSGKTRGSGSDGSPQWVDVVSPEIPLKDTAQLALNSARAYVQNNFILLGETPPEDWIAYQKSLISIVNGTDTTSTSLPTSPEDTST